MTPSAARGVLFVTSAFTGHPVDFEPNVQHTRVHVQQESSPPSTVSVVCTRSPEAPCSICLEAIAVGAAMSLSRACLGAGALHAFHEACAAPWFRTRGECPNCRTASR